MAARLRINMRALYALLWCYSASSFPVPLSVQAITVGLLQRGKPQVRPGSVQVLNQC
jgi:hypothetical protein